MTESTASLRWIVFNSRTADPAAFPLIRKSYELWYRVWSQTFRELDGDGRLSSDDFSRHHKVCVLFEGENPIGMFFLTGFDHRLPMWRHDSAIKAWPEELLDDLVRRHRDRPFGVCCYFLVAPERRGDIGGFSMKQLLSTMCVEHLYDSDWASTIATVRVNRNMDGAVYELGARSLREGLQLHGVEVSLIEFEKATLRPRPDHPCLQLARALYESRLDFTKVAESRSEFVYERIQAA